MATNETQAVGATAAPGTWVAKVTGKEALTHDVAWVKLRAEGEGGKGFRAGQFVRFWGPAGADGKPVARTYSLALPPGRWPEMELMVRRVPGGLCSNWVHDTLAVGDEVRLGGPMGRFGLSAGDGPMVCIAGSSGMAPLRSLLLDMAERGIRREAKFFFGARSRRDLFLGDEWRAFAAANPWFEYVEVLSDEPEESGWTGERGLVTDAVARRLGDLTGWEAYLCGSPGMVDSAKAVLGARGVDAGKIFFDRFNV